jgi:hypothetical protein
MTAALIICGKAMRISKMNLPEEMDCANVVNLPG